MLGVVGDLVEDVVVWFAGVQRYATDNPARITRARGGSGANVAATAAGLVATRFIGCVGDDALGDQLIAELAAVGVDVRVQRRGRTGAIVVLVDGTGERTMFPDRGASAELSAIPSDWLAGLRVLHVPSYCFAAEPAAGATLDMIRSAHERQIEISVDASSTGLLEDLGLTNYLDLIARIRPSVVFANAREAALLDLSGASFSAATTVVKQGGLPALVRVPGRSVEPIPVQSVAAARDTTGAGDAFAAGFLAARLHGADPFESAAAGHVAARSVLLMPGATTAQ